MSSSDVQVSFAATMCAVASVVGVWIGEGRNRLDVVAVGLVCTGIAVSARTLFGARAAGLLIVSAVLLIGAHRSSIEWRAVDRAVFGPYHGPARVVGDSAAVGRGRRVVLEIESQRFEAWVFGSTRNRVEGLDSGDVIEVVGTRRTFDQEQERRLQIRHVVGRFDVDDIGTVADGRQRSSALVRAANRVRAALKDGSRHMSAERAALFTGLVYGDDSSQPSSMVADFRASGLAHLTAVSGQNVVFVLSACGPVLSRLSRPLRVGLTILTLAWFAIMTRLEPSVVRAVIMAGVTAVTVAVGRPVSSWIALCITVCAATIVDPFLVWSVGWWLSVSGCAGLILLTKPVAALLTVLPSWVSSWAAPTVAAQAGVLGVLVTVFGWPSAVAIPCNLLAAPVAGFVMLVGLPIALASAVLPESVAAAAVFPVEAAVAWVDAVAFVGARLDPPLFADALVSIVLIGIAVFALRRSRHIG